MADQVIDITDGVIAKLKQDNNNFIIELIQNGEVVSTQLVDVPELMTELIDGRYDNNTKEIILTLKNEKEIKIKLPSFNKNGDSEVWYNSFIAGNTPQTTSVQYTTTLVNTNNLTFAPVTPASSKLTAHCYDIDLNASNQISLLGSGKKVIQGNLNIIGGSISLGDSTSSIISASDRFKLNIANTSLIIGRNNDNVSKCYDSLIVGETNSFSSASAGVKFNQYIYGSRNTINKTTATNNNINQEYDYIFGNLNQTNASQNYIVGYNNKSERDNSYLIGENLISNSERVKDPVIIMGNYNEPVDDNVMFAVGIGEDGPTPTRKNGLTLNKDGDLIVSGYVSSEKGIGDNNRAFIDKVYVDNEVANANNNAANANTNAWNANTNAWNANTNANNAMNLATNNKQRLDDMEWEVAATTTTASATNSVTLNLNKQYNEYLITFNEPVKRSGSGSAKVISSITSSTYLDITYNNTRQWSYNSANLYDGYIQGIFTIKKIVNNKYFMTAYTRKTMGGSTDSLYQQYINTYNNGVSNITFSLDPSSINIEQGVTITVYGKM